MEKQSGFLGKALSTLLVVSLFFVATALIAMKMQCSDVSKSAKKQFAVSMYENGAVKFPASLLYLFIKLTLQNLVKKLKNEALPSDFHEFISNIQCDFVNLQ